MGSLLSRRNIIIGLVALALIVALFIGNRIRNSAPVWTTEKVTRGDISNIVSVSGIVKASDSANLAFPVAGIVTDIPVHEGDVVKEGQVLAVLEQRDLQAERSSAAASLLIAKANRDELVNGPTQESKSVTDISIEIARADLARTASVEDEKVASAYRTLLSDGLEALPVDSDNGNVPPIISGTYQCSQEGIYTLSIYPSSSGSGYSYDLSGLESGTYTAYSESPTPMGNCGLKIKFAPDEIYASKKWVVAIPNTHNPNYIADLNAYTLAKQNRDNNVSAAKQALEKALREQALQNATPRDEALTRADASVIQAEAQLAEIDARIADRTLRAPYDGIIGSIAISRGESFSTGVAMTLVANDAFELTVRIPEIDISRVSLGQQAEVLFDAAKDQVIHGTIVFIAPEATQIDGVAYFEAKMHFSEPPAWLRGGLNADVNIVVDRRENVLRIPKRFLIESSGASSVLVPDGKKTRSVPVTAGFSGNDGFVEITGLTEGDTIVAP